MPVIRITKLKARLLANVDAYGEHIPDRYVAAACDMAQSKLSMLALGRTSFSVKELHNLANYFECKPSELAGDIEFVFDEYDDEEGEGVLG